MTAEQLRNVLRHMLNVATFVVDRDARILFAEGQLLAQHGLVSEILEGTSLLAHVAREKLEVYELHIRQAFKGAAVSFEEESNGDYREVQIGPMVEDEIVTSVLVSMRDISHRKNVEEQLRQIIHLDPLTRLSNRRHFDRALQAVPQSPKPAALVYIDLDDFKLVNDERGHPAGDECLREVARCLRFATRTHDICARLGGDEFAVLLPDSSRLAARTVMRRIEGALDSASIGASMGCAVYPEDATTGAALLHAADDAMYKIKRAKKGGTIRPKGESR